MTEKDELIQELKGKVESLEKANKILRETSVDIIEMCEIKKLLDKLTQYQKLEERGLLLKIPCKTGDTVYRINEYAREPIIAMKVTGIHIKQRRDFKKIIRIECIGKYDMDESCYLEEDIGKRVFLTCEEACLKYLKQNERRVNSITEVDLSRLKVPVAAVYERPLDFPTKYVIRIFDVDKPTNTVIVKDTLEELMEDIATNTNMAFLTRGPEDDEHLIGVWM